MKELSIEQKAKAYDEALERAEKALEVLGTDKCEGVRQIFSLFPELKESEDEKIKEEIIDYLKQKYSDPNAIKYDYDKWIVWLEKQGEQKPTQEIEPFEAEHGKYYYCIKDYFCGGRKQASKGDVVQALRGLPIMGLKDAGEYFLPVNSIKCNSAWSEEDEEMFDGIIADIQFSQKAHNHEVDQIVYEREIDWLKSLKERIGG